MKRRRALTLLAAGWLAVAGASPHAARATALDDVFPDGLPVPFERVLERLRAVAGADAVRTALIPLGRSLQRHSAAPDYFGSPRVVVAVTQDGARGPQTPRLADRLFLGYVPAAAVVEVISYDEEDGRFAFQEIVGYGSEHAAIVSPGAADLADRAICLRCHQGEGPIFARPLWSESNANPAVAARLGPLGEEFHGVPVNQSIDQLDAFDASTDRAARLAVANRLWSEGCPEAACRADLLLAALRFGLNGARADWQGSGGETVAAAFDERVVSLWPEGISVVSPDLPNRDPAPMLSAADPGLLLDAAGALDPEAPRPEVVLWKPDAERFDAAAREVAALLAPGDYEWLDDLLRSRDAEARTLALGCTVRDVPVSGGSEIRFRCTGDAAGVAGFLQPDGSGRIDRLTIEGAHAPARIGVRFVPDSGAYRIEPAGLAPRLPDGARVGPLTLHGTGMQLDVIDDFAPLAAGLRAMAHAGSPALEDGPFRRRRLLALLAEAVEREHG